MLLREIFDRHAIHDLQNPKEKEVRKIQDMKELAEIIKRDCSTMYEATKNAKTLVYRGVKGAKADVIITGIRQDRKPVEMDFRVHTALDEFFKKQGIPVTRTNGLFTSASEMVSRDWGSSYIVFIKNGWTGLVFESLVDNYAFYELHTIGKRYNREVQNQRDSAKREMAYNDLSKEFKEMKPKVFDTSAELTSILKKQYHEMIFSGDSYIGIREDSDQWEELLKYLY